MRPLKYLIFALTVVLIGTQVSFAATFSDVPESNPYYIAVESLSRAGIIRGYSDGTFRPNQKINRAEALKIILKSANIQVGKGFFNTGFSDVPIDSWYAGYVMQGALMGVISGNPDGTFAGERTVNEAEYLKMTLKTFQTDLTKHINLVEWIASDTPPSKWFSPYLSYGKAIGLIFPDLDNNLYPSKDLTRGDSAQIIYKMHTVYYGGEAQKFLSLTESKLIDALVKINNDDVNGAINATEEAVNFSELAITADPNSSAATSSNLIANAFQKLFAAYKAGISQDTQSVILLVLEARQLANQAVNQNESALYFSEKINEHGDILLNQLI